MSDSPVITLTTDFGCEGPFAGVMKGVILTLNPHAKIIDFSHGIRPYGIVEAAFLIGLNYRYFPKGTMHAVVVDPGVGSERRPLIVSADNHYFIGPDNGVFSYIFGMRHETPRVVHVTASHYFLSSHSPTFQGRDVFASVAGWLSKGIDISKFGPDIADFNKITLPLPTMTSEGAVQGEVIFIDRFGNAITNIRKTDIERVLTVNPDYTVKFSITGREAALKHHYSEAESGNLCALLNSSDLVEFFVYKGNASQENKIIIGDKVTMLSSGR